MGLTDEEYDFMPSDQYEALKTEWLIRERARYAPAAQIAALLFNINRGKGKKPRTPADFMPEDPLADKKAKRHGGAAALAAIVNSQFKLWKQQQNAA